MILNNGKTIGFYKDKVTYDNYCYEISDFVYGKTLEEILDDIKNYKDCFKVMNLMYQFYLPIATKKRVKQHAGCRGTTKQRDSRMYEYGLYKNLLNQVKKLQMEIGFERRQENV